MIEMVVGQFQSVPGRSGGIIFFPSVNQLFVIERSRVRIPAGAAGEFSSPGSTFCADSYLRFSPVLPQ